MKTNNLHHPTYPQWVNGLATLALVAAGMTLWWVTTASQMENRVSPVSPQSQLEQPTAATPVPQGEVRTPVHYGPVATIDREPVTV